MTNTQVLRATHFIANNTKMVLDKLGIDYQETNRYFKCKCPIHGGDGYNCCLYKDNAYNYGIWKCFSHGCHEIWGRNVLDLFRGILSIRGNSNYTISDAAEKFINEYSIPNDINFPAKFEKPKKTKATYDFNTTKLNDLGVGFNRKQFRDKYVIPSPYFIKRGYQPSTLEKYDVGDSLLRSNSMYDRAVVPFYDPSFRVCVGVTARSLHPKCLVCRQHHIGLCPDKYGLNAKWIFNESFYCHEYFYNYWYSKGIIKTLGKCILVEGPGDIWRLEECGIRNGLAICGTALTWNQILILKELGIKDLIISLDSDEAGFVAADRICLQLRDTFSCKVVELPRKDIGEMSKGEINKTFRSLL